MDQANYTRREWLLKMAAASATSGAYLAGSSGLADAGAGPRPLTAPQAQPGAGQRTYTVQEAVATSNEMSHDIDMLFGDWHTSTPSTIRGSLEVRAILTRGNPLKPTTRSAVLRYLNSFSYASVAAHTSTTPVRLDRQQEIYYFLSGRGTAAAAGRTVPVYQNLTILMPANLEFTINNTGDEPLTMYLINEPTPEGFRPNPDMLLRDENSLPFISWTGFWDNIVKQLFVTDDGLGTLQSVLTVTLDPLTVGQPHLTNHDDIEEVWAAIDGSSIAWLGNQLRRQTPGIAYLHPPWVGFNPPLAATPHCNINDQEGMQALFLYFARYHPHAVHT